MEEPIAEREIATDPVVAVETHEAVEDSRITALSARIAKLEEENKQLKAGPLSWMIVTTPETNHPTVRVFRDRIQASLSTFFGRKKLGIEGPEDTLLMLGLDLMVEAGGYVPVPGVSTAINIMVNVGKIAYENLAAAAPIVTFNSFADIDRLSFLVAEGIAAIYSPQIKQLNESQALVLASSAHDSLESFLKRAYSQGKTVITPDQLILVLGKYYLGTYRYKWSKWKPHRRAVFLGRIDGENWYDMDLFLGSGISVSHNGRRFHYGSPAQCAYYYSCSGVFSGCVYTRVPDRNETYGH